MTLGLMAGPLARATGWALLHLLWQGTLVAGALAVVLRLLAARGANARYVVACAALALVVALGIVTAVRDYAAVPAPAHATIAAAPVRIAPSPAVTRAAGWPARLGAWNRVANDALPRVVALWLAGVVICSMRLVVDWLRVRRMATRLAVPAGTHLQAAAKRLAAALGVRHAVRLLESAAVEVPSVIGFMRPAILLPASTLTGLTPAQLEMILAHELAHIRRHDFLVNLLQAAVETLLFYHPAVWWISRQVRIERENCCDDLAVSVCGTPLQYARALTRLEELRAEPRLLAVSANGGSLRERVLRLAGRRTRVDGRVSRGVAALAVLPLALLVIAAPSFPAIGAWEHSISSRAVAGARRSAPAAPDAVTAIVPEATGETPPAESGDDATDTPTESVDPGTEAAEPATPDESADTARDDATRPAEGGPTEPADGHRRETAGGRPTVDDLIQLGSQGVSAGDARAIRSLFPHATWSEIASMAAVGATPEFVRELRSDGIELDSPSDAAGMAAVGVTPEFIRGMRAAGLRVRSASEAQGLAALGVTPEFVRQMRDAGLDVNSADEAQGLAALGVTPELVRGLRGVGLQVNSARDAQGLAALGVTPEFVRALRDAGVQVTDAGEAQGLAALGVTPEFVHRLSRAGYRNLSAEDLSRLAAAGVTDEFIRDMSQYRSH